MRAEGMRSGGNGEGCGKKIYEACVSTMRNTQAHQITHLQVVKAKYGVSTLGAGPSPGRASHKLRLLNESLPIIDPAAA